MPASFVLRPCAKVNLALEVGDIRPDGFHEVKTILQSLLLTDRLTFARRAGPFRLTTGAAGVPQDRSNLVWRAAEVLWRAMGRRGDPRDARVRLEKRIPVAAGLGGGSADAAAALVGLSALWRADFTVAELARLAGKLGADVPFFLHGGTALGTGRGDVLSTLDDVPRMPAVIVVPTFGISAADAYRWFDEDRQVRRLPGSDPRRSTEINIGWAKGQLTVVNDLEPPATRRHPEISDIVRACQREGAIAAAMTGSGSAVFGLFRRSLNGPAVRRLRAHGWRVIQTRTATQSEASRRISV